MKRNQLNPLQDEICDSLTKLINKCGVPILPVNEEKMPLNSDLSLDLGLDSLQIPGILAGIQMEFVIDIYDDEAEKLRTMEDIILFTEKKVLKH